MREGCDERLINELQDRYWSRVYFRPQDKMIERLRKSEVLFFAKAAEKGGIALDDVSANSASNYKRVLKNLLFTFLSFAFSLIKRGLCFSFFFVFIFPTFPVQICIPHLFILKFFYIMNNNLILSINLKIYRTFKNLYKFIEFTECLCQIFFIIIFNFEINYKKIY